MKHKKKLAALLVSCQILATLTACNNNENTDSNNSTATDSSTSSNSSSSSNTSTGTSAVSSFDLEKMTDFYLEVAGLAQDEVVARSGDVEITAKEMIYLVSQELDYLDMMAMYGMGSIPWGEESDGMSYEKQALTNAVELAIIYHTIDRIAEEEGLEYDPTVEAQMEALILSLEEEFPDDNIRKLVYWDAAMTPEIYLDVNRRNNLYSAMLEMYFGEGGSRLPDLSDMKEQMEKDGYYKVKHILIATTDQLGAPYDDDTLAERLALAESLVEELSALEGDELAETFHELMVEHGEDPGAVANPEGYDAAPGMMVPEFEAGSLALEIGEVSGIVESAFGYHIIYRLPLSEVTSITDEMMYDLETALQDEWIDANPIEYTDAFDSMDLFTFYENINKFREDIIPVIESKSFDVAEEEEEEEESDETDKVDDTDSDKDDSDEDETEEDETEEDETDEDDSDEDETDEDETEEDETDEDESDEDESDEDEE